MGLGNSSGHVGPSISMTSTGAGTGWGNPCQT